jgi:methanogenic corrinoid protein MtbC1
MNAFTIRDLENLSGIKAHTIRIWELRYSFLKPKRSNTNIRYYDSEELKKLLNVALLNRYGYKISHISKMDQHTVSDKILSLTSTEAQQERIINELLHGMIDLDTEEFESILDKYIRENGIDNTINNLIFPFMQRIGILWLTDHVRIAQEHLVSNVIRQKLIMGIENTRAAHKQAERTILLFLPEGEHHELGILYVYYLLRTSGVKVIYLGADVPVSELEYVCKAKSPTFLFTHLTSLPPRFNMENYLNTLQKHLAHCTIVMSGRVIQQYSKKIPPNVRFKKSLEEVMAELYGTT